MCAVAVIPARLASVRFPGKVLADRTGKPLIQHVFDRAQMASRVDRVIVAIDDDRIAKAVQRFGGEYVMTRADHPNGTSRIAEAVDRAAIDAKIIVNVQGDEPELDPALIDQAIRTLEDQSDAQVATVAAPFAPSEDALNPNVVKVVLDQAGGAMYFSRSLIPFVRDAAKGSGLAGPAVHPVRALKHVGLYVYRREFLPRYVSLPTTPLEQCEQLEQLRILEHGFRIAVAIAPHPVEHHGIDTPEQYDAFVQRWAAMQPAAQ